MKWVLLFFCTIFLIILFILTILILCTIRLNVKRVYVSNYKDNIKKNIEKEIIIFVEFFLFGKIKIAKFKLSNNVFSNMNVRLNMKTFKKNFKKIKNVDILDVIKKLKIQVEKAYLNTEIGTKDVITTAFLVTFISSIARNNI